MDRKTAKGNAESIELHLAPELQVADPRTVQISVKIKKFLQTQTHLEIVLNTPENLPYMFKFGQKM